MKLQFFNLVYLFNTIFASINKYKMRSYQQTLDYLFSQLPMYQREGKSAYKANLDNTIAFDNYFESPHKQYKTIHIAGTNGKGSVSHMIASIFQEAGYKTGLYTSPHLRDFRERIKVNGMMIPEKNVIDFVENHQPIIDNLKPSFFEMTVAMAFEYFADCKVDIAIIETGMGGRLDSTNIITPELSVITNIGLDHTQFLGDTITLVAGEKAGIIKPNVPVVIGEWHKESSAVFNNKAKEVGTSITYADANYSVSRFHSKERHQSIEVINKTTNQSNVYDLELLGLYQHKNILTVLSGIDLVKEKFNITKNNIKQGLKNVVTNTGLLGRWQILDTNPLTICDTGHNTEGITYILEQLKQTKYNKLHFVLGMVNDKDIETVLKMLPKDAEYYFTNAKIPRAMPAATLAERAINVGLQGKIYKSVEEAQKNAKKNAADNDLIFIGGSTFIVAEVV